jgi:hypothetical protein
MHQVLIKENVVIIHILKNQLLLFLYVSVHFSLL